MFGADDKHPWAQQANETAQAYAAFCTYRDLAAERSIDAVARQLSGHRESTKRAPGRLKKWSVAHDWAARARAWDQHQARVRQAAAEAAERASAERWVRRRDELLEREYTVGKQLLDQAYAYSLFPAFETSKEADGKTTKVTALPPATARSAASIAREGAELARGAIDRALVKQQEEPHATTTQSDTQKEATRRVEAHRAAMRARMLTTPAGPPGKPPDPPGEAEGTAG